MRIYLSRILILNVNIKMLMLEYNMRAESHVGSSRIIVITLNKISYKEKGKAGWLMHTWYLVCASYILYGELIM